MASKKAQMENF